MFNRCALKAAKYMLKVFLFFYAGLSSFGERSTGGRIFFVLFHSKASTQPHLQQPEQLK